jgi:nucleoside-diphosphate-sugar epimerase
MKILVTGVLGTVGSILKQKLQAKGQAVLGIDLYHAPGEVGFTQKMSGETFNECWSLDNVTINNNDEIIVNFINDFMVNVFCNGKKIWSVINSLK